MNKYDMSNIDNHHFTNKIFEDSQRLLARYQVFAQKGNCIPTDDYVHMIYFNWSRDHLNRCYQLLKELKVIDYSRNNRRSTLKFIGDYVYLNKFLIKLEKKKRSN